MRPELFLLLGGILAIGILSLGIIFLIFSDRNHVDKRLDEVTASRDFEENISVTPTQQPITSWLNQQVEGTNWAEKISKNLARADIRMKPGEYIALLIISAFFTGFVFWLFSGKMIILGFAGVGVGLTIPGIYVSNQQGKRLVRFNYQLSDMLNLMVNGLRAGYSTLQAMEAVSRELPPPISDEFRRVVQEMQLGLTMEKAMDNLLRRIPSEDLDLIFTAINVQREVGGNLAEILDTISYTIRERVRIKGEIRVLTSQVMYSGRFLALLPIILVLALFFFNKEYIMEFFRNGLCGYIALGFSGILIIAGYIAMNKLAEIEI